jgi:hypothetical protein
VALAALLLLAPLVGGGFGSGDSGGASLGSLRGVADPLLGSFALVAAIGAIVALATRVPGESRILDADGRAWIIGPLVGAIGLTAGSALELLGIDGGDIVTGPAMIVAVGSFVFASRLPVVQRPIRRLLVAPFVLLSGAVFQGLVTDFTGSVTGFVDLPALLADSNVISLMATVVVIILAVSWIFYSMLIFAPRELADPGAPTRDWAARYLVFLVSLVLALLLGGNSPVLVA